MGISSLVRNTVLFSDLPCQYQDALIGYLTDRNFSKLTSGPSTHVNIYTGIPVRQSIVTYCDGASSWTSDDIIRIKDGQQPISREQLLRAITMKNVPSSNRWKLLGWMPEILPSSEFKRAMAFMDKQLGRNEDQQIKQENIDLWLSGATVNHKTNNGEEKIFTFDKRFYEHYDADEFSSPEQWSAFVNATRQQ